MIVHLKGNVNWSRSFKKYSSSFIHFVFSSINFYAPSVSRFDFCTFYNHSMVKNAIYLLSGIIGKAIMVITNVIYIKNIQYNISK